MNDSFDKAVFQDFHIHASGYRTGAGGQMTIDDSMIVEVIVRRAEELGLKSICILEHLEPVSGRHPWQESLKVKREVDKIKNNTPLTVFSGCEASIVDLNGNLSAPDGEIADAGFDVVIASFHQMPYEVRSIDEFHDFAIRMMSAAGRNKFVNILGHPWRDSPKILAKALPGVDWNFGLVPEGHIEEIAKITSENNVYAEISMPAIELDLNYLSFIKKLNKAGAHFSVGSDAHSLTNMKEADTIFNVLSKTGISNNKLMGSKNANSHNI